MMITIVPAAGALLLLLLFAAAVPAGSITTELEARTWATLLTTPLTAFQVLFPKVAGSLRRLWLAFLFVTLHLIICTARGIAPPGALPFTLAHFTAYAIFLCCTGVFFSLICRKSAVASTLNLSLAIGLWLLAPIFCGILASLFYRGGGDGDFFGYLFFTNPVFTYCAALAGMCSDRQAKYDMGPAELDPAVFYGLWFVSVSVYLACAWFVMGYARRNFQRLSTARA
jgi:ABC-type transport system involved in multi-copper enzyme maturation permease subunit